MNEPDFVIKFHCKNCGQKISVPEIHAGKKGKCPKCKNVVIVPALEQIPAESISMVRFKCSMCDEKVAVPESSRGKLIECPKCGSYVDVPSEEKPAATKKIPIEPHRKDDISDKSLEALQRLEGKIPVDETEEIHKRKLPWLVDIFLYPISKPGLTNLAIFTGVPLLIEVVAKLLGPLAVALAIPSFIINIVIGLYMYWYFAECIRDSAMGGLRAPETLAASPGLSDMFSQALNIVGCFILFLGPAVFYTLFAKKTDTIFWILLGYGIFFFPMGLLAVIMFDSGSAFNPVLLIGSIFSAFFQYCGLLLVLCGVALIAKSIPNIQQSQILASLLSCVSIYLAMVSAHLLGRFYWKYQEKLNWEV